MTIYRIIDFPSDEPVQFVGVYTTQWGRATEPTVGFVEVEGRAVALMEENIRLRAALEAVHWVDDISIMTEYCAWCKRHIAEGDAPDCQRELALAPSEPKG